MLVNERAGVLVLSEHAGVHDELGADALSVYPVDIEQQVDALCQGLFLEGYDALPAADGEEGLRLLGQQPVDVLLLDIAMPMVGGMEVLEALGPPPPKVILLSAFEYHTPEDINRSGLGKKISRILRKPCPPVQLLAAVDDTLDLDDLHPKD